MRLDDDRGIWLLPDPLHLEIHILHGCSCYLHRVNCQYLRRHLQGILLCYCNVVLQIIIKFHRQLFDSHEECDLCTSSLAMPPEVGHSVYLLTILMVLHVADRQVFN